jgi:hypothetical protein
VKLVEELLVFEGGSVNVNREGFSYNRNFSGVAISATSNTLMVVENASRHGWIHTLNILESWDVSRPGSLREVAS